MDICNIKKEDYVQQPTDLFRNVGNPIMILIDEIFKIAQEHLLDAFCKSQDYLNFDRAKGNFLDILGIRNSLQRPVINIINKKSFIFDNVPFGKVPFGGLASGQFIGIADRFYKDLIQLRVLDIQKGNSNKEIQEKLDAVYNGAKLIDNADMTITITISSITVEDMERLVKFNVLPKPDGVRIKPFGAVGFIFDADPFDSKPFA